MASVEVEAQREGCGGSRRLFARRCPGRALYEVVLERISTVAAGGVHADLEVRGVRRGEGRFGARRFLSGVKRWGGMGILRDSARYGVEEVVVEDFSGEKSGAER